MFFTRWKDQEKINRKVEASLEKLDNSLDNSFKKVKVDVDHLIQWVNYLHHGQDRTTEKLIQIDARFDGLLTKQDIRQFVDEYYRNVNSLNEKVSSIRAEFTNQVSALYSTQKSIFERLEEFTRSTPSRHELEKEIKLKMLDFKHEIKQELLSNLPPPPPPMPIESEPIPVQTHTVYQPSTQLPQPVFDQLTELNTQISELKSNVTTLQEKTSTRQSLKEKIFKKVTRHSKDYVKSYIMSLIKKHEKISGLSLREIVVEEQGIVSKSSFYRILTEIEEEEGIHVLHEGKEKHYWFTIQSSPSL
ncbi:hypothetical protein H6503_06425 [Candidatus Woesearchaeota archaeon]|nr:hypothetical protein [Candidatus Woesearchaeota archaeon]